MATLTADVTLVCANQAEHDENEAKIDSYTPSTGEPDLSNLTKDAQSLTLTYTLTFEG